MLSAWKKFINRGDINQEIRGDDVVPPGIQKLDKELQRKFAKGVNYNMKVVIKGDKRVGKTSLFLRLKGFGFDEAYNPTENLNVTSINWSYKATDDIVKIDLWEAIDVAAKKDIQYIDLKLDNNNEPSASPTPLGTSAKPDQPQFNGTPIPDPKVTMTAISLSLNSTHINPIPESAKQSLAELSENLDVYKGAHAVILVMDMTKLWTFKYIQKELPKIPNHIPVLVVANHRDKGHHRTVSSEQVTAFIEGLDRTPCDGIIMYTESSMKNGFGLKVIEKFFNIPFLKLQEVTLLKQLELNRCDYLTTLEELQIMQESTNREYEQYLELRTALKRQEADAMSPVNSGLRKIDETTREHIRNTAISSNNLDKTLTAKSIESNNNNDKPSNAQTAANQKFVNDRVPSIVMGAKCPLPEIHKAQLSTKQLENLSECNSSNPQLKQMGSISDESDEEEVPRANPLVADYQSDLDSDDQSVKP